MSTTVCALHNEADQATCIHLDGYVNGKDL